MKYIYPVGYVLKIKHCLLVRDIDFKCNHRYNGKQLKDYVVRKRKPESNKWIWYL